MPSPNKKMSYPIEFTWEGGIYITITVLGKPVEVINVGKPTKAGTEMTIETREEFMAACEKWVGEQTAEQMRNWRYDAIGYPPKS